MTAARWLLRLLCSMINHRGPALDYAMDESGEWMIFDCRRCQTVVFKAMHNDVEMKNYQVVLDRYFQDD